MKSKSKLTDVLVEQLYLYVYMYNVYWYNVKFLNKCKKKYELFWMYVLKVLPGEQWSPELIMIYIYIYIYTVQ